MTCDHCCRFLLGADVVKAACGGDCCSEECAAALDRDYELDAVERFDAEWRDMNLFARLNGGRE